MKAGRIWTALTLALLLSAACQRDAGTSPDAADGDAEADESAAIPVEISSPTRSDIYAMYSGTAPVEAFAEIGRAHV